MSQDVRDGELRTESKCFRANSSILNASDDDIVNVGEKQSEPKRDDITEIDESKSNVGLSNLSETDSDDDLDEEEKML